MKYLLDTNTCIRFLNGRSVNIQNRLLKISDDDVVVCSVVKAEMFYGSAKSQTPEPSLAKQKVFFNRFVSLDFDDGAAEQYGIIRAHLERTGQPIGPNDLMIAAIALAHNIILITHNTREFGRIPDLRVEDWEL